MGDDDRARWNDRYRARGPRAGPSPWLLEVLAELPGQGRALDVAGGTGVEARVLADHGLEVTVVDVSDVALAAVAPGITTLHLDLEHASLPAGPWDVITSFHYLQRSLFPAMRAGLAPMGSLVAVIATRSNLERHPAPSARWLLDDGELPSLVPDLDIVRYEEGWSDARDPRARHEARLLARRPTGR